MKNKLIIFSLMLVGAIASRAQNAISIYQNDGDIATFAFSEKPVVSYSNNELVLSTKKTTVKYPIYQLKKIAFDIDKDAPSNVKDVEQPDIQFQFQRGSLAISGGEPGSLVFLYDVKGVQVGEYRLNDKGCVVIPTQHLAKDIYIVKTKNFTFKFLKS